MGTKDKNARMAANHARGKTKKLFLAYYSKELALSHENWLQNLIRLSIRSPHVKIALKTQIKLLSQDELDYIINSPDVFGQTPLDMAMVNRDPELVYLLLYRGADPLQGKYGLSLAHMIPEWRGLHIDETGTLYEQICQNAAQHFLSILAKDPKSNSFPREIIIRILSFSLMK